MLQFLKNKTAFEMSLIIQLLIWVLGTNTIHVHKPYSILIMIPRCGNMKSDRVDKSQIEALERQGLLFHSFRVQSQCVGVGWGYGGYQGHRTQSQHTGGRAGSQGPIPAHGVGKGWCQPWDFILVHRAWSGSQTSPAPCLWPMGGQKLKHHCPVASISAIFRDRILG